MRTRRTERQFARRSATDRYKRFFFSFWFDSPGSVLSLPFSAPSQVVSLHGSVTTTSVLAQWGAPQSFNGIPQPYSVSLINTSALQTIHSVAVGLSLSPQRDFTSLSPYSNYTVSVAAISSGGVGQASSVDLRTDATGKAIRGQDFRGAHTLSRIELTFNGLQVLFCLA